MALRWIWKCRVLPGGCGVSLQVTRCLPTVGTSELELPGVVFSRCNAHPAVDFQRFPISAFCSVRLPTASRHGREARQRRRRCLSCRSCTRPALDTRRRISGSRLRSRSSGSAGWAETTLGLVVGVKRYFPPSVLPVLADAAIRCSGNSDCGKHARDNAEARSVKPRVPSSCSQGWNARRVRVERKGRTGPQKQAAFGE